MATTSIWRVKGWLGKVLIYVENPDKTENPAAFEKQGMDGQEAQGLSDVIEYAARQEKTGRIQGQGPMDGRLRRTGPRHDYLL